MIFTQYNKLLYIMKVDGIEFMKVDELPYCLGNSIFNA